LIDEFMPPSGLEDQPQAYEGKLERDRLGKENLNYGINAG
jgi:hypothetical protein